MIQSHFWHRKRARRGLAAASVLLFWATLSGAPFTGPGPAAQTVTPQAQPTSADALKAVAAFASWLDEARSVVDGLAALLRETDTLDRIAIDLVEGRTDAESVGDDVTRIIANLRSNHESLAVAASALGQDGPNNPLGPRLVGHDALLSARENLSLYAQDLADRIGIVISDSIAGLRAALAGMSGVIRDVTARSLRHFGTLIAAETALQQANLALIPEAHPNHHLVRSFIATNDGIGVALESLNLTLASGRARDPGRAEAIASERITESRAALARAETALAGYQLNLLQRTPSDPAEVQTLAKVRALFNNIGAGLAVERLVVDNAEALIDTVLKQASGDTAADGDAALAQLQERLADRNALLRQRITLIRELGAD